jgi:hypothetical protein
MNVLVARTVAVGLLPSDTVETRNVLSFLWIIADVKVVVGEATALASEDAVMRTLGLGLLSCSLRETQPPIGFFCCNLMETSSAAARE